MQLLRTSCLLPSVFDSSQMDIQIQLTDSLATTHIGVGSSSHLHLQCTQTDGHTNLDKNHTTATTIITGNDESRKYSHTHM